MFAMRQREADEFYATVIPQELSADAQNVMRQALCRHAVVQAVLSLRRQRLAARAIPAIRPRPPSASRAATTIGRHLYNADVISMPDKWEYPWYAAWDLAFHCVPLALVDPDFAKEQLMLLLREWYMHPNGQIPAYEWAFGDVNPPVHAWAAGASTRSTRNADGQGRPGIPAARLPQAAAQFHLVGEPQGCRGHQYFPRRLPRPRQHRRLRPQCTTAHWWLHRAIRRNQLDGHVLAQPARDRSGTGDRGSCYEDVASKFWEHFVYIADAMSHRGHDGMGLWNEEDGFFYDVLKLPDGTHFPMKIRSMVGLIPLFAVETLEPEVLDKLPDFKRRLEWFIDNRPDLTRNVACMRTEGDGRAEIAVHRETRTSCAAF